MALVLLAMTAANAESATPKRDLTAESEEVALGTAAYVHTDYSAGAGMLLPGGTEVLVARHIVLAPDGTVAAQIGVGLPRAPLNNIVEVPTTIEAQDPLLDLVLLRVASGGDVSAGLRGSLAQPCGDAAVVAVPPRRLRRVKRRYTATRRVDAPASRPVGLTQTPPAEARLRIVVDGPLMR